MSEDLVGPLSFVPMDDQLSNVLALMPPLIHDAKPPFPIRGPAWSAWFQLLLEGCFFFGRLCASKNSN